MVATFHGLTSGEIDTALDLMARLYAHERLAVPREYARSALEGLLAHPEFGGAWLISMSTETVGYLVLTVGYSIEFGGRFGLLDEFFIDESWRGQGIGTQAMAFAEEQCRVWGMKALRLEVGHENARALGLYRRSGFVIHDRHFMTKRV